MRILFLSRWFPYPPSNGSRLRALGLLRGLATRHEVTLLSFSEAPEVDADCPQVLSLCRRVEVVPWREYDPRRPQAALRLLSRAPRSVADTYSVAMERCIRRALEEGNYDLAIAAQLGAAAYAPLLRGLPALFDEVEVGLLWERYARSPGLAQRLRHGLTWLKHRRYLASLLPAFAACTVVSAEERALLRALAPRYREVHVIPNCVDLREYGRAYGNPVPGSLVFTGSFRYAPNYRAMVWFLERVFPRLREAFPEATLTVTGDHAGLGLPTLEGVSLVGHVEDVRPLVARAWVDVAPILEGGGTRLKILEAMALGTPVVATRKGAEGLDAVSGEHLLVADAPEAFADATVAILADAGLRGRLADAARDLVVRKYDQAVVMPRFLDLVESIARSPANTAA